MRVIVTFADNGLHVVLKLREKLEVRLPESQASGYLWQMKVGCPGLRLDDSEYAERGAARFNGLGERSWFFAAVATGENVLRFYLIRPWSAPSQEYTLFVSVK